MFDDREEDLLCEIDITQNMVKKHLNRLRDDKASGPDELVPRFLNGINVIKKLQFIHKLTASDTSKTAKITKR